MPAKSKKQKTKTKTKTLRPTPPSANSSLSNNSGKSIRTHPRGNTAHILMMPRIEWRIEMLRLQIPNQSNLPMPKRDTKIEQSHSGMHIAARIRTLEQLGSLRSRHKINRVQRKTEPTR
jgi:hypothetical protein